MLKSYKTLAPWSRDTLPKVFQEKHNTKEGTWAKITVTQGQLEFTALTEEGEVLSTSVFSPGKDTPYVEPQQWHKVTPLSDDLECQLEFLCEPERYFEKKYSLTAPHSEVQGLLPLLEKNPGASVLDLGSGRGRNSFFLQGKGFAVTSVDKSEKSIQTLKSIQEKEGLSFPARVYNINAASIGEKFDHVISTVVFQFLDAEQVSAIIEDLQGATNEGGYHLIVAPIDTEEMPCPIAFSFRFSGGELRDFYQGWDIVTYEEVPGEFHRRDENGDRYKAMFATLIARKKSASEV